MWNNLTDFAPLFTGRKQEVVAIMSIASINCFIYFPIKCYCQHRFGLKLKKMTKILLLEKQETLIFCFFSPLSLSPYILQHDTLITSDNSSESLRLWANPFPHLAQLNKSNDVTADGVQLQEGRVSFHYKNVLLPNKRGQAVSRS